MSRRVVRHLTLALALATASRLAAQQGASASSIDIPFQKFVLDNGLTLIVHEDHKAPIVAVNVWYHVGSKNEKPGKTGFAHLFEHLMFNGSEHFNDDYVEPLERMGATDLNGTTSEDRTNYFQNVPTPALDAVLWMESDRMGHLLGAIDQARLDEQRGVVQNEKRQGEDQPYGKAFNVIVDNTYPKGHPYSWSVIGSMEDLNAASLDDVKEWFQTYYGAANAVVVIAGDIDAQTAKQKVERYFGHIPSGPPIAKLEQWTARRSGTQRAVMQDRVPQARLYKVWNVPAWSTAESDYLDLITDLLAVGKTSRLYKRLVYDDQIATDVVAFIDAREIGGQILVWATARPGGSLAAVERAMDEELARFLRDGPTPQELQRVKTQFRANFLRGIERIGGFGGKSDVLAQGEVYAGRPDHYKTRLERVAAMTAADIQRTANAWLADGAFVLEVQPFPQYQVAESTADRTRVPEPGPPPAVAFPRLQRATLPNGLTLVLAERHSIPQVNMRLVVDAGYAADRSARPGTARLALDMMDEGTTTRSSLQISEQLALLGATLGTGSNLDASFVAMSALKDNFDASLEIFADVALNPAFPQADFDRLKQETIARIRREKVNPQQMALRVFPPLLYGEGHAYGMPLTGSGTEEAVSAMTREDLAGFHRSWFKPNKAMLVVVGDVTLQDLRPRIERLFRGWQRGETPTKNIATVSRPANSGVYLLDRPGSQQSVIIAGHLAPPKANPDEVAIEALNQLFGGLFTSRLNMNLREDKHWSYGAFSLVWDARGQRPFITISPVQTDKTRESVQEVINELRGIRADKPVTADELGMAQAGLTLTLPGQWETMGAVLGSVNEIVQYGLPDTHFDTYAQRVRALKTSDVNALAQRFVQPDQLVWVIVGDRSKIEAGIRELNLGEIKIIDADGKIVRQAAASDGR
ncbi:MAG: insulinase family protein [Gemmatimonadetes bacterium]|nr:insulinase family protein [Gemmatimonadota bacterium]